MKIISVFISFILLVSFTACTEINPLSTATNPVDTTGTSQLKKVLLEDVTGVRCPNCPAAHEIADELQQEYAGRVEVVSIHNGILASPFPFSQYSFKISIGTQIDNYLGPASSWPKGAIDRVLYEGQNEVLMERTVWAGIIPQRLDDTLKVAIGLSKNYDAVTRKLDLTAQLNYLTEVNDEQKITVLITESGLVDPQEFPDHIDTFYVHNNVLRGAVTDPLGDPITETTAAGAQVSRVYSYTIPNDWNPQRCRVVAFVSVNVGEVKEILQVNGIDVE